VSLTTGRGPLSADPAGRFTHPLPRGLAYLEPFPRRVRAVRHGATIVDSERVLLVHRRGVPPIFAFPVTDVTGVATEAEPLADGYVRVAWDAADAWFEEEEQVFMHPRNPYHRVDCVRTSRRLLVEVGGTVLVDTADTLGVYETALDARLYVRRDQVIDGILVASPTKTYCPYKGTASYWSAMVADMPLVDVAWSYEDPYPECRALRGQLCFDESRVTVAADLPGRAGHHGPG
jgi:uncharacterized protein (DUF427 family)